MVKRCIFGLLLICAVLASCAPQVPNITLTETQNKAIECVLKCKDAWQESWYHRSALIGSSKFGTTNRVYFWEEDGTINFTYGYYKDDGKTGVKHITFNSEGLVVDPATETVTRSSRAVDNNWLTRGKEISLQTMSDSELKAALEEAYKNYLSQKDKK